MLSSTPKDLAPSLPYGQSILSLKKQSDTEYTGIPHDLGWKRLYGGHLIAQSLLAAQQSPYTKGSLDSFHAYFLHVGNCRHPLAYTVSPLRTGRDSSRIQVQAQQKHRQLFHLMSSHSTNKTQKKSHTPLPPSVPAPDTLPTDHQMLTDLAIRFPHSVGLQSFVHRRLHSDNGLDITPISPKNFLHSTQNLIHRRLWFRMRSQVPDEYASLLLAYTSDFLLVGTSLQPQNLSVLSPNVKFVSLDHAMWFYHPVPQNEWILLDAKSEVYTQNRSLVRGEFYTQSGVHIASCVQEGFIHIRQRATTP